MVLTIWAWLVQAFFLLTRVQKSRLSTGTGGFMRARAGGALTAIVSMACGITVLTHIGPHSQNLGESVDSAAMPLTFTAYPRGWVHFVPSDTVTRFWGFSATRVLQTRRLGQAAESCLAGRVHDLQQVSLYCDYFAAEVLDFAGGTAPFAPDCVVLQDPANLTLPTNSLLRSLQNSPTGSGDACFGGVGSGDGESGKRGGSWHFSFTFCARAILEGRAPSFL